VTDPSSTREQLLDAATRLFAERGIDNVSIAEIVRTAGQRNVSAVHYHFGNRDEVLRAVLARHVPTIAARRQELLARARATPGSDIHAAVEAIVRPVTEFAQRGWQERAYLQIGSELSSSIKGVAPEIMELMTETIGHAAWKLFRSRVRNVPSDLWWVRQEICIGFIGRTAADRARLLEHGESRTVLSDTRFVDNLIDMVIGAMTTPQSPA
jgi:AcrR family transcriptional regulator